MQTLDLVWTAESLAPALPPVQLLALGSLDQGCTPIKLNSSEVLGLGPLDSALSLEKQKSSSEDVDQEMHPEVGDGEVWWESVQYGVVWQALKRFSGWWETSYMGFLKQTQPSISVPRLWALVWTPGQGVFGRILSDVSWYLQLVVYALSGVRWHLHLVLQRSIYSCYILILV